MVVLTDLSVQSIEFDLGQSLSNLRDVRVEFERSVPVGKVAVPYLWAYTCDQAMFERLLRRTSNVKSVHPVQLEDDRGLYRIEWDDDPDGFLECLSNSSISIVKARGTAEQWDFRLRFDSHDAVSRFQKACTDRDVSLSIERVVSSHSEKMSTELLSPRQRETIELALEKGYFDVPRRTTMVELAEELGISDQAVSARIRRAMKTLSKSSLNESGPPSRPTLTEH